MTNYVDPKKGLIAIFARMKSRRLPGKALINLDGKPAIGHLFDRVKKTSFNYALLTSDDSSCDQLAAYAKSQGIAVIRGDEEDLFDRIYKAHDMFDFEHLIRVTGDDLFLDIDYLDDAYYCHCISKSDYTFTPYIPKGCEFEIIKKEHIDKCLTLFLKGSEHTAEYLTYIIKDANPKVLEFKLPRYRPYAKWISEYANHIDMTLDTKTDLDKIKRLVSAIGDNKSNENIYYQLYEKGMKSLFIKEDYYACTTT